ncbi:MAG: AMP-binding protein [Acidimicrobiia bacterium]|nr:AMP-binding protein [Acidimicrobiia bacterium]
MDRQPIVWKASAAEVARSRTADFMARHGIGTYQDLVGRSIADLEWFWEAAIGYLGIPFSKPYHTLVDTSDGIQFPRWFSGGEINISEVCVDRWVARDPERTALVAEQEDGTQRSYSFGELLESVERAAGALAEAGAAKGDTVAVYLPMTPEAVVSMLAAARIGAIYVPIFSGFGTEAVASRLEASQPAVMVTADGYTRRGNPSGMKETADRAIETAGVTPNVIVVSNLGQPDTPWTAGRDRWWEESLEAAPRMGAVATTSEDPVPPGAGSWGLGWWWPA